MISQLLNSSLFLEITTVMPTVNITAFLLLIFTLLFIVALSAGAEVAFFTLNIKDINYLKMKGQPGSKQAIRLLDRPDLLLAGLRASKYILSIVIILATHYILEPITDNPFTSFILVLLSLTFILLLFGEILPKVYARENNIKMVLFSAPIVNVLLTVFKPAAKWLVDSKAYREEKRMKQNLLEADPKEFADLVKFSMGHDATKEEIEIFKSILKFGRITVKQIMLPRLEIGAIRKSWDFERVLEKVEVAGYSRMPVYDKSIDTIVGMIYTKDLLPYQDMDGFDWHSLMRPAFFVHERKLIDDLLREFQQKRNHFAIVVDEFGGTSGVVTLEDVMEEIIGDIRDEFDEDMLKYRKIDEFNYIFEGKVLINDMCRIMGIPVNVFESVRGQSDSLAGLLLELSGKFPKLNERISFKKFDFTILDIDGLKVEQVKVEMYKDK